MHSVRTPALATIAALILCVALASSAFAAPTLKDWVTGTQLAIGSAYNISSTGSSTLTGSFFGFATTVTCSGFQATGTIQSNPGASATITSAKFVGCHNSANTVCTSAGAASGELIAYGLPWTPGPNGSNQGGIVVSTTANVNLGTGTGGSFVIPAACTLAGDCAVNGGGVATSDSGGHYVSDYVHVSWFNPTTSTSAQASISLASIDSAGTFCVTGGSLSTSASAVRTGSTVGSGDLITIV